MGPDHIIMRLRALRDPRIRALTLVEAMGEGESVSWVEAIAAIVTRAHNLDDADALEVLETVTHAAADPGLTYATRKRLYEAAIERNLPAIARLFLVASPNAPVPPVLAKQLGPERPLRPPGMERPGPAPGRGEDRPLTLGERKSLARTHRRDKLTLMVRDPHPAVVEILLSNPHVTESDVVKMAAARPAVPDSLSKIAAHPRWSVRHAIKRALVLNPATPLADAIRIATTLKAAELTELAADASLPEALRQHASEVLANVQHRPRA